MKHSLNWMHRFGFALSVLVGTSFCGCIASPTQSGPASSGNEKEQQQEELFDWSINVLNHVDEYDAKGAVRQVLERLNQWIVEQPPLHDWQVDPMVASLAQEFRELQQMQGLDALQFQIDRDNKNDDNNPLLEAVWMRDVAKGAVGNETDDLARAKKLFDWTVRNIQLDGGEKDGKYHYLAGNTLIFGQGAAEDRAWVFILLARQQGLDVVMLALPSDDKDAQPRPWLPALLLQGQLYLFDTRLGLAIPAPGTAPLADEKDSKANKSADVATLAQAAADDTVLQRMDLPDATYPIQSTGLTKVVALIEASPMYLTQRMQMVESRLAGDRRLVLSTHPTRVAEKLKAISQISDVRLWSFPYERYLLKASPTEERKEAFDKEMNPFNLSRLVKVRTAKFQSSASLTAEDFKAKERIELSDDKVKNVPALWQARVSHLMGKYTGRESANELYQLSRPSDEDIALDFTPEQKKQVPRAKQDASYWLGLVAFERGLSTENPNYFNTAIHDFAVLTLKASPSGPWTPGAKYNLGRSYEALGKTGEAIAAYRADLSSSQKDGNLLRAKWLEERSKD